MCPQPPWECGRPTREPNRGSGRRRGTTTTAKRTTGGLGDPTNTEHCSRHDQTLERTSQRGRHVYRGRVSDNSSELPARPPQQHAEQLDAGRLRRIVLVVALLNLSYFFVEFSVALVAGSVSLLADSVDFLEDTAINLLIFTALGWPLARRATMGKAMAVIILGPAAVAGWEAIQRFSSPLAPDVVPVVLASLGAIAINGTCAWLLVSVRHHGGSLSRAAFLSARNDVLVNVAIIAMAVVTLWTESGWPDLILGCFIILLALYAAYEVWGVSDEERLAAKALAGEAID